MKWFLFVLSNILILLLLIPLRFKPGQFILSLSSKNDEIIAVTTTNKPKFAYFTLLSGVDPNDPGHLDDTQAYIGFLLNLVVVKYLHDITGNTADLAVLLQMKSKSHVLPKSQEDFLSQKLGYRIIPVPAERQEFGDQMLEKFRILDFPEYDRILFFDADAMMICQTDYLFELSMNGTLAPNLVLSWNSEPAQGGFFMLEPGDGDFQRISKMRFINATVGFGTPIHPRDVAEGRIRNYTNWTWHGAKDDQGLLYHWTRYVKRNVSIVKLDGLTHFRDKGDNITTPETSNKERQNQYIGTVHRDDIDFHSFPYSCPNYHVAATTFDFSPIQRDHVHFTGLSKPWKHLNWENGTGDGDMTRSVAFWGKKLHQAWKRYNLPPVRILFSELSESSYGLELERIDTFLNKSFDMKV